jgi:hypothetical protein
MVGGLDMDFEMSEMSSQHPRFKLTASALLVSLLWTETITFLCPPSIFNSCIPSSIYNLYIWSGVQQYLSMIVRHGVNKEIV